MANSNFTNAKVQKYIIRRMKSFLKVETHLIKVHIQYIKIYHYV